MKRKFLLAIVVIAMSLITVGSISALADTTINVSSMSELQSVHPYSNNMNTTWVYTYPTAVASLDITFSSDTETESGYDYIYIYDGNDNLIKKESGTALAGKIITIPGNVVKIKLTSDGSVQKNGFTVTKIDPPKPVTVVRNGICGENLTWELNSLGALTIYGNGNMDDYSNTTTKTRAPWYNYNSDIRSVEIQNGVTTIGSMAFDNCRNLTNVTIPESVTNINKQAFNNCKSLTSIVIPSGVTSIEEGAFWYCENLTSITIPDSLTYIGESAFSYCTSLTSIIIPDGVTFIARYAFDNCSGLASVTIPDSVTSIGYQAFYNCRSLNNVTIPDSLTYIGEFAFAYCTSLTSIDIPDAVTSIGAYAFTNCTSFTNVDIPDSVTYIGKFAFDNCSSLKSIAISDSVTQISESTFNGCYSLANITIPEGVTSIRDKAFYNCTRLVSITIPNSVINIEKNAFDWYGGNLKDVYYYGTHKEWNNISISDGNENLNKATIHFIYPRTETVLSNDDKTFTITPINIATGNTVILALYNGTALVEMQSLVYTGESIPFTTTKDYANAKVFVWENFETLVPICEAEIVK